MNITCGMIIATLRTRLQSQVKAYFPETDGKQIAAFSPLVQDNSSKVKATESAEGTRISGARLSGGNV